MATKRWQTTVDGTLYDVEVRSPLTGTRVLVNGVEQPRDPSFREKSRRLRFTLGGHPATLLWISYGRTTEYDLVVDGRSVATGGQPRPPANPYESLAMSWALLVAVVAILGFVLAFGALPEIRLAAQGVETTGTVTGTREVSGRSTAYYLMYTFTTQAGEVRTGDGQVDFATYVARRPGETIAVRYVPSAPDVERPASYDERWALLALVGMFAPAVPYTAAMVWRGHRLRSITAALADRAIRTDAAVERVTRERFAQGSMRISYRYTDLEGRDHTGRSARLYPEEASAYTTGSRAKIAYDPNHPGNSIWIGAPDPNATVWVPAA